MLVLLLTIFAVSVAAGPTPGTRHQAVVDIAEDSGAYRGKIHVNGELYDLHLEQTDDHTVFAPSFRLTETIRDPSGEVSFRDVTPVKDVRDLERSIFVDKKTHTVFRILNDAGKIQVHGIMNNIHISNDGVDHFAVIHDFSKNSLVSDYIDADLPTTPDDSINERDITIANPELFITIDYKLWTDLDESDERVLEYIAIMIRAVNSIYSLMEDPQVKFSIVESTILKDRSAQPFIEDNKNVTGGYVQDGVLSDFAIYMYKQGAKVQEHDMSPLLSGEQYWDSEGLAIRGGACVKRKLRAYKDGAANMTYQVSVNADQYGKFVGVHTLTHEMAHTLGAPHDANYPKPDRDPEYDTSACPWDTGYIMTYRWNSENQFIFSQCSKRLMKKYLSTTNAKCVREVNAPGKPMDPATKDPGAVVNMDQQCAVTLPIRSSPPSCTDLSAKAAWDKKTPDELCSRLTCDCRGAIFPLQERVLEGTPCRKDGTGECRLGKCVG